MELGEIRSLESGREGEEREEREEKMNGERGRSKSVCEREKTRERRIRNIERMVS